jgi:cytochrome c oxidase subunit II
MLKASAIIIGLIGVGLLVLSVVLAAPAQSEAAKATPTPGVVSQAAVSGAVLFEAKGCAVCHAHAAIAKSGRVPAGPNLTTFQSDPTTLRKLLADPKSVRPTATMPNLNLTEAEINALVAFLGDRG